MSIGREREKTFSLIWNFTRIFLQLSRLNAVLLRPKRSWMRKQKHIIFPRGTSGTGLAVAEGKVRWLKTLTVLFCLNIAKLYVRDINIFDSPYSQSLTLPILSSAQSLRPVWPFATPWTPAHQASCPSPTPRVHPNPCPSSRWCHPTISSSVVPFSSCPQSFPTSGSFQMSQLFASGGQNIGVSTSVSVLPVNIQDWSPLEWTSWISLQSKGLLRVFNTTIQKHQFFGAQLSL